MELEAHRQARHELALALADYHRGSAYPLAMRGLVREALFGSRGSRVELPNDVVDFITHLAAPVDLRELPRHEVSHFLKETRGPFLIRRRATPPDASSSSSASAGAAATPAFIEDYACSPSELMERLRANGLRVPNGARHLRRMLKQNADKIYGRWWDRHLECASDSESRAHMESHYGSYHSDWEERRWHYLWDHSHISGDDFDHDAARAQQHLEGLAVATDPAEQMQEALQLVETLGAEQAVTVHELRPCFRHCAALGTPKEEQCLICQGTAVRS